MYVIRNLINWRELGKRMVKYATISAVMLGIIVVLSIKMSVRWVSLLLIVMSGVCIYFSILIIIKDDNINMFFSYFKSILIKFGFLKQRR